MPMPALLKVLFLRMFRRAECRIAITVTLLCCLIAFGETCFKFYGADVGELPSAAYAWAWNMDAMQVNASRVYLFFVMPVAAALVFADAARQDLRSGAACLFGFANICDNLRTRLWDNELYRSVFADVCGTGTPTGACARCLSCGGDV